ncbi:MAG: response regulator [Actinomycetota bacterium]|nr:response regulator [Actinomycetota bacterium]
MRLRIVMADDDEDDVFLTERALAATELPCDFRAVPDGAALLQHLRSDGGRNGERPHLILLDLNMPKMTGHEALRELKADEDLRTIPVVVLTTSHMPADVQASYDAGAASYVCKPVSYEKLVDFYRTLHHWWGDLAELPGHD